MPELVGKPREDWTVEVKCGGPYGCGYTYRYTEQEILKDTFKVSGYDFDGSADWQMKPFVYCGNCKREITLTNVPPRVLDKAPREKGFGK